MTDPRFTNRLIHEKSPYLLQHAHNPVNWYPWGPEAFEAAKEQDKPIFLSIGYATCHWCHVMERESFEDVEVAKLMNESFINIKVDREELPDVDSLYMEFAQSMMAGAAGWPLNLLLTPDLLPFFSTTYLPSHSSHGMMGLIDLIHRIVELWTSEEKEKIINQSEKIVEVFGSSVHSKGDDLPSEDYVKIAADVLYKMADPIYGGIKGAPKFPIGYQNSFLLRYYQTVKDNRALFLAEKTLQKMYQGGIYDHLGGGFSRYSVDEEWLVPHFEKMIYDNAILAQAYMEAWQLTKRPLYKRVSQEILNYILRDMTHPQGGFYSAEDADSEGVEGLFYTWSIDEIEKELGDDSRLFIEFYGVTPDGNFEGKNILHTAVTLEDFANNHQIETAVLEKQFEKQRKQLWKIRESRPHPLKDDKVLSAWNGLVIYSLTQAGMAFNEPSYVQAAVKGARFIRANLWQNQQLLRRWRDGQSVYHGSLDEYAFLIRGLLALFEANAGSEWLIWAVELSNVLTQSYKDEGGAFFQTDGTDESLILRKCQFSDGAEPSGNAIQTENLLKLYQLTNDSKYLNQAEDVLKAVKFYLDYRSPGYSFHMMNVCRYYDRTAPTIVIALNSQREHEKELKELLYQQFIPHKAIIWQNHDVDLEELIPFIKEQEPIDDKTTLYICHQGYCDKPITDFNQMKIAIDHLTN